MLEHKLDWLQEQIRLGQHKKFGASSEKTTMEDQMALVFNETEGFQKDELLKDLPTEPITNCLNRNKYVLTAAKNVMSWAKKYVVNLKLFLLK